MRHLIALALLLLLVTMAAPVVAAQNSFTISGKVWSATPFFGSAVKSAKAPAPYQGCMVWINDLSVDMAPPGVPVIYYAETGIFTADTCALAVGKIACAKGLITNISCMGPHCMEGPLVLTGTDLKLRSAP